MLSKLRGCHALSHLSRPKAPSTFRTSQLLVHRGLVGGTFQTWNDNTAVSSNQKLLHKTTHVRLFHATRRQEIVPLIGAAVLVIIGRYSYRAIRRMEDEWDEYQWQLYEYEKQQHKTGSSGTPVTTLALDLGTIHLKLAQQQSQERPSICINNRGDRYQFNGVAYDEDLSLIHI